MNAAKTPVRLEFKYPVSRGSRVPLGLGLRPAHPDRWVASLYFDSPDWRFFAESEEGLALRSKLRLRTYHEEESSPLKLEIKKRDGRMGHKVLVEFGEGTLSEAGDSLGRLLGPLGLPANLEPKLVVRYRRSYFTAHSLGQEIRVTWDRDIGFSRWGLGYRPRRSTRTLGVEVIEVKGPLDKAEATEAMGRRVGVRRARFSKYALGVQLLVV